MPRHQAALEPLRVVVADDHPLFRAGIVRAIQEDGRFAIVGEAHDAATAERLIRDHSPNVATNARRKLGAATDADAVAAAEAWRLLS